MYEANPEKKMTDHVGNERHKKKPSVSSRSMSARSRHLSSRLMPRREDINRRNRNKIRVGIKQRKKERKPAQAPGTHRLRAVFRFWGSGPGQGWTSLLGDTRTHDMARHTKSENRGGTSKTQPEKTRRLLSHIKARFSRTSVHPTSKCVG